MANKGSQSERTLGLPMLTEFPFTAIDSLVSPSLRLEPHSRPSIPVSFTSNSITNQLSPHQLQHNPLHPSNGSPPLHISGTQAYCPSDSPSPSLLPCRTGLDRGGLTEVAEQTEATTRAERSRNSPRNGNGRDC